MPGKPRTPLDLELNLFENSFAAKDLSHAHGAPMPEMSVSARSTGTSLDSPTASSISRTTASGGSSEMLEIKPKSSQFAAATSQPSTEGEVPLSEAAKGTRSGSQSSNKHNLRISNFGSVNNERLTGLTPPLFTPGGRRLPPIHFSPGLGMGSPGTPGSQLWNSLITATGTSMPGQDQSGLHVPPSYPSYMRKSGLVPTESNLRSGLTPGLMGPNGFNFNMHEAMASGQMTPGLQTLLGLVNSNPLDSHVVPPAPTANSSTLGNVQAPSTDASLRDVTPAVQESQEPQEPKQPQHPQQPQPPVKTAQTKPQVKEEAPKPAPKNTKKRASKKDESGTKAKAQKTGKDTKAKVNAEAAESTDKSNDDEELDDEEKRKSFLERNRVAALKCRQRKKQQLSKMENELAFYSDGYRDLTAQVTHLRDHVVMLRGLLVAHKDCPALSNAVGGYQHLQNIINQSELLAHGAKGLEINYQQLPTTVPTMLNNHQPAPKGPHMNNQGLHSNNNVDGMGHNESVHDMNVQNGHGMHHNRDMPFETDLAMARHFPQETDHLSGMEMHQQSKDNLRPVNSASNLQHIKHENQISGYDLRPIASMADLQHASNPAGMIARQFQL